jgi:hypothetical protein
MKNRRKNTLPIIPQNTTVCCSNCDQLISYKEFNNFINIREFLISGLCQKCQNKTFKDHGTRE